MHSKYQGRQRSQLWHAEGSSFIQIWQIIFGFWKDIGALGKTFLGFFSPLSHKGLGKMSVPSISKAFLSTGMPPMSNSPHALVTTANVSNNSQNLANFENLLPRSPYIPPDVNNTMASGNAANSLNSSSLQPPPPPPRSSAPPAHQSPKQVGKIVNTLLSTINRLGK